MVSIIKYVFGDENSCDYIESLWLKLNEIHYDQSTYFKEIYKDKPFADRIADFLSKAKKGELVILLAKTNDDDIVGYCVSSVCDNVGEIESICIDENYRNKGIGNNLMEMSLDWLKSNHPQKIIVKVSVGHEEVFPFYEKHGFYPRLVELQMK